MSITALTISAHSLKALAINGSSVKKHEIILPPGTVRNGLILQPEVMSREIKTLLKTGKISASRVVCSINGLPFSYRMLTVPTMEGAAFTEAVLRTAKKEMSISPDEMYLSWQAYPTQNNEWQVLVAGITRLPVDNLIKALSGAGITPWLMDLPHLALARLSPEKDAVIVDFEKDCSNIVMIVDGVPRGMHMVPMAAAGASLQDQIGQVADKLAKMIDFYNGSHPVKPIKEPARILVTGDLLDDEKSIEYLRSLTGNMVEYLTTEKRGLAGWPVRQYPVNAGLLDIIEEKDGGKNVAPYHQLSLEKIIVDRRPKTDIRKSLKKILLPAAIVGGISVLAMSYLSAQDIQTNLNNLQTDFDRACVELYSWQQFTRKTQEKEANISEIAAKITDIKAGREQIFSSRSYVDILSSIIASMPEELTFNSLQLEPGEISLGGSSLKASSVVQFAENLKTTGGFQDAVITWIDQPHGVSETQQVLSFSITIDWIPDTTNG